MPLILRWGVLLLREVWVKSDIDKRLLSCNRPRCYRVTKYLIRCVPLAMMKEIPFRWSGSANVVSSADLSKLVMIILVSANYYPIIKYTWITSWYFASGKMLHFKIQTAHNSELASHSKLWDKGRCNENIIFPRFYDFLSADDDDNGIA